MLGHFRHEVGHYYEMLLVQDTPLIDDARAIFGDDRQDYQAALQRHYQGRRRRSGSRTSSRSMPPLTRGKTSPKPGHTICTSPEPLPRLRILAWSSRLIG